MKELEVGSTEKDVSKDSIYYQSAGVEAMKKWKAMSEEERRATKTKNDDIDAIDTSELEKY